MESPRIIAILARTVNDVGLAEDLAADAVIDALDQWPQTGIPASPAAWLTVTAKRRAVDRIRRDRNLRLKYKSIAAELATWAAAVSDGGFAEAEAELDDDIGDELLRVVFTACHPVLSVPARTALTLKVAAGLQTGEIARAYLVPEATIAQRIVRAKRKLQKEGVRFEPPRAADFAERLAAVLEVVYLVFNEGYTATSGDDLMRPQLCEDAIRMAQRLASLLPNEPEVLGLAALLDFQGSRTRTRIDENGDIVRLADQTRTKWDRLLIRRGMRTLYQTRHVTSEPGPYQLQAAIAACHARALRASDTDWVRIAALYTRLLEVEPSPIVALNRAVAFGMAFGPVNGLRLVDEIAGIPALEGYHLVPTVRAEMLARLGQDSEARAEFRRAAGMTANERERRELLRRAL
nr:sigma-70 family RNA polymerase sigma factor [Hoyosella altamirensis]